MVTEMVLELPTQVLDVKYRLHQDQVSCASCSWGIVVQSVFWRKPDGIRGDQAVALRSVMAKWYASALVFDGPPEPHEGGEHGTEDVNTFRCC